MDLYTVNDQVNEHNVVLGTIQSGGRTRNSFSLFSIFTSANSHNLDLPTNFNNDDWHFILVRGAKPLGYIGFGCIIAPFAICWMLCWCNGIYETEMENLCKW
jgi:hypothetical protein